MKSLFTSELELKFNEETNKNATFGAYLCMVLKTDTSESR